MRTIALQQVTNPFARGNAKKTLEKPIHLKYLQEFLGNSDIRQELDLTCKKGTVFVWGAKLERSPQWLKMFPRKCLFLFRQGNYVNKIGVLDESIVDLKLAEHLWGTDKGGETWGLVFFFSKILNVSVPASEINRIIGFHANNHWQGLIAKSSPEADEVIEFIKAELVRRSGSSN
jgi:hypothetical protein